MSKPAAEADRPAAGSGAPVAEGGLRASDADRDRTADILREALAEGRLTPEEHSERIDGVYRARRVAELEPLVRDLPAAPAAARHPAPPHSPTDGAAENLVAVFGGASRRGRWRVGRLTRAFACFGGVEIDLTEAVFEQQEIVIRAVALFGGVEVRVPENVSLRGAGTGIFGGFDVRTNEAADPEAPVVVVTGFAAFGGVDARAKRGKRLKNLRERPRKELGD
ncbi:DUF1707 domain-containing protein [Streptomyces sp. NPDC001922]|uniref:DUF1707 SHOCT-like domain-containing protein n=1 Tax=Streptomyces sp. NPDC001922 TaxID=3364624 RepID=UPI0036B77910